MAPQKEKGVLSGKLGKLGSKHPSQIMRESSYHLENKCPSALAVTSYCYMPFLNASDYFIIDNITKFPEQPNPTIIHTHAPPPTLPPPKKQKKAGNNAQKGDY